MPMARRDNPYLQFLPPEEGGAAPEEEALQAPAPAATPDPVPEQEDTAPRMTRTNNPYAQFLPPATAEPAPAPEQPEDIDPTWQDYGRMLASHGAGLVEGAGWLIEQVGKATSEYGIGVSALIPGVGEGVETLGRKIKEVAGDSSEAWLKDRMSVIGLEEEGLSENARNALQTEYLGEATLGEKFQRLKLDLVGSLPGTAAGMGIGRMIATAARASTATGTAAAYGTGEAAVAAPSTGASVERDVQKYMDEMGHEALMQDSPEYAIVYSGLSGIEDQQERIAKTQELLRDAAAGKAAAINTFTSFIFGAALGNKIDSVIGGQGGRLRNIVTGAGSEASTELGQSGAEQIAANVGMRTVDPTQEYTEGALEAAVGGAAAGATMGGGVGALTRPNQAPRNADAGNTILDQVEDAQNRVMQGTGDALDDALAEAESRVITAEGAAAGQRIGRGMNTVDAVRAFNQETGRLPTADEIQAFRQTGEFPMPGETEEVEAGPQTLEEAAATRRQERQRAAAERIETEQRAEQEYGPEEQATEDAARARQQRRAAAQQAAKEDLPARVEQEKQKRADFEAAERQRQEREERQKDRDFTRARAQAAENAVEQAEARTKVDEPGPALGDTAAGEQLKGLRAAIQQRKKARAETGRQLEEAAKPRQGLPRLTDQRADVVVAATGEAATKEQIDAGAQLAATSPENDLPQPTQAQIEAGNYRKGKVKVQGLDISIENPRGSTREGPGWKTKMRDHYGYVRRSDGADGEQVDVFVGDKPDSDTVFVVDQVNQETGEFDEHKAMVGYGSQFEAARAYRRNYGKRWKVGQITPMSTSDFKRWLRDGDGTRPAAEQQVAPPAPAQRETPLNWAVTPEKATKRTARDMRQGKYELVDIPIDAVLDRTGEAFDPRIPGNQIGNRLAQARERLDAGQPMDPPVVGLSGDAVMFEDGRHRTLAARELGETTVPALVPRAEVDEFVKRVQGAQRRSAPVPEQGQLGLEAPAEAAPPATPDAPTKRVTVAKTMRDAIPALLGAESSIRTKLQAAAADGSTKVDMTEAEAQELVDVLQARADDTALPAGARRAAQKLAERVEQVRSDLNAARTAPTDFGEFAENVAAEERPAPRRVRLETAQRDYGVDKGGTVVRSTDGVDMLVWKDDGGIGEYLVSAPNQMSMPTIPLAAFSAADAVAAVEGASYRELVSAARTPVGQPVASEQDVEAAMAAAGPAQPAQPRDPTQIEGYGQIRTKTLRKLVEKDDRIVGVSVEPDGVFIYTDSTQWSDDSGAGTFRGNSETEAVRFFKENVQRAEPGEDVDLEAGDTPLPTIEGMDDEFIDPADDIFPAAERERLNDMVSRWRSQFPGAKFQIVDTIEGLPGPVRRGLERRREEGKPWRASGLYREKTGEAFVILESAKAPNAEAVMSTVFHEVVQHQGMRGLLGEEWHETLDQIWHTGNQNAIRAIAKRYKYDVSNVKQRRKAVDEYMAAIAGSERGFDSPWWQRAIDYVRAKLREAGLLDSWTDDDIRRLLRRSRERLRDPNAKIVLESGEEVYLSIDDSVDQTAREISAVSIFEGAEELDVPIRNDRGLAEVLEKRSRAANRGKALTARTRRNKEILSQVMADEVAYALTDSGNAADWYSSSLREAVEIASEIHPELRTSDEARALFLLGLAVTSNGSDVMTNARDAERVWAHYKRYRKFPTNIGKGPQGAEVNKSLEKANEWMRSMGTADFVKFLNTEFTVAELNLLGVSVSGEGVNHRTYGSAMFGPKIGGGFYQNLMGNFEPLTMDRWWMKMWGRITGSIIPTGVPQKTRDTFLAQIEQNPAQVELYSMDPQAVLQDDKKLYELARRVHKEFADGDYTDRTDFNRAAKNVDLYVRGIVLDPGGAESRNWMREVTDAARQKLHDRNIEVDTASLQALLWYPEKKLYRKYAGAKESAEGTDYAKAFEQIFREKGGSPDRIDAARTRALSQRSADGARAPDQGAKKKRDPGVALRVGHAAAVRIRELGKPAFKRSDRKRAKQLLSGAKSIATITPDLTTRTRMEKAGYSIPEMHELENTPESAKTFRRKILAAKKSNGATGSAVHVYEQADYEGMRLFTNSEGTVGFALKGDDIVSLFKSSKAKNIRGAGVWTPLLAVQEGGRRLDAFDTVLPHMYAGAGFKVVSRTPFNEEFQPEGWSQQAFREFNNGKPDVVFMVYDKTHTAPYAGRLEGERLDYDAAAELQLTEVERLNERNKPGDTELDLMLELTDDQQAGIDSAPDSPLARMHKLGATAEAQTKYRSNSRSIIQRVVEFGRDPAVRAATMAVPRRYLSDFVQNINLPQVDEYLRTANRMTGRRNELLSEYEDVAGRWSNFVNQNKREGGLLSELMHASTLAGADPSKPYKPMKPLNKMTPQERLREKVRREQYGILKGHYDRMSDEAKGIYNEVRDSYTKQRQRIEEALYRRIEESVENGKLRSALNASLRAKLEAGRVQGPYFPLMRFGEFYAVAKDGDGEVVSFSKFESRSDQREWTREFREAGYEVTEGRKLGDGETIGEVDPEFVRQVQGIVEDPALQDEIWQAYLRTLPEMSVRKQFIHRKGRLGFAADALRAYGHLMFHGAHQTARVEFMPQLQDTLQRMRDRAQEIQNTGTDSARVSAKHVYDEMEKRHKASMAPSVSPLANGLTSLGFAWYLGATPAAALVNLTQTALVGYPVLSARFGAVDSMAELSRLSQWYGAARGNLGDGLRGDEQAAFKEASRIGLFERTMAHDIAGVAEEGAVNYGGVRERTMRAVSWFFHRAEQMNREVTFMAAYRLARKKGRTHDDAILEAEDLVWDSHFDYNNENRPRFMQGNAGRVLLLFKQYSLNMTYRITRDFLDSIAGETPAQRREARVRFGGMMGMTMLMAGAAGLPGVAMAPLKWVLNTLLRDDEEDPAFDVEVATRVWLTDMVGATAAEAIMKGPVDTFTPITLSNRVGLGELWLRDPQVGDSVEDVMMHYITDLAGPVPAIALNAARGAQLLDEGQTYRAIEKFMPKVAADVMRAYRYSTDGALTLHTPPDTLMAAEDFTWPQRVAQAIGFTPSDLTLRYEQNEALRNAETRIQQRRQEIIDRYALAFFNEDDKGKAEQIEALKAFNRQYPTLGISGDVLARSLRTRVEQSAKSLNGLRMSPKLRYLEDQLRFTPREEEE